MHSIDYTVNHIHKRSGWCGNGGVCPSVHKRPTETTICVGVQRLVSANERIQSYASDRDMT